MDELVIKRTNLVKSNGIYLENEARTEGEWQVLEVSVIL